jgi:release factor glutamine methyltransferase
MIYSPAEDSYLLEKEVRKYSKGKTVLDIGSGSGILALTAISSSAKSVIAVDIDIESINHLKSIGISALRSNLFSKVKGKFDLIIFNPPYLPLDNREPIESRRATTGGKKGDEIILRFLKSVNKHLCKEGKILLLLSSLTPQDRIDKLISKTKMKKIVISSEKLSFEKLEVWLLNKIKNKALKSHKVH